MLIFWPRFHTKRVREYLIDDFLVVSSIRYSRDQDIGEKCEGICELEYVDCISGCSGTDCLIECGRTLTDCTNGNYLLQKFDLQNFFTDCPCNLNCPNGCSGCPNLICICGDNPTPQNKQNLETCRNEKSLDLGLCIIECNYDLGCEYSCVDTFKDKYRDCPCQVLISILL